MKNIVIAIDNGKMNFKGKLGDKELFYKNKYSEMATEDENLLGNKTFNVIYKTKSYTIGEKGNTSDRNEGKASEAHIVQALTGITRFIDKDEKSKLVVMYGESADMYFDATHKQNIKNKLEGKHTINVNGISYNFEIELVQILPEGIGHILQDFNKYSGVQYVVDIGGGTINYLTVEDGRPEPKRSKSVPMGVNTVVDDIIIELKRCGKGDYNRERHLILQYLNNRETCKSPEVLSIIDRVVISHFKDFDNMIAGFTDIHKTLMIQPVYFIGGGAELFKHHINKYYKSDVVDNVVVSDALMANVRGFHSYGIAKFSK